MSQTVARLKELLFDNEAQALAELSHRVDQVAANDASARAELKAQIDDVMARAGSAERFTQTVADVIDEALRRAEVSKHHELSISIAPLVVSTIKTELKNSQDEMVEALYPITGRLVKSYVASAIKDLTEQMNRRLEQNPLMLRLQSIATGRPVGELALASTQTFEVRELFLIRRGSGELVAHWPQEAGGREHLMSGVLAAVNAFANEALSADEGALRQIDLGDEALYLRGSPLYLLAAKCSGTAPAGVEQALDEAFLATIEKELEAAPIEPGVRFGGAVLSDLGTRLAEAVETQNAALHRPRGNPLKVLAILIALPLLAWFGWTTWVDFANNRARDTALHVVASMQEMQGYPAQIDAFEAGQRLSISGLAPSQAVKDKLLSRLTQVLPRIAILEEIAVVPGSDITIPDAEPRIAEVRRELGTLGTEFTLASIDRLSQRTLRRLQEAIGDLEVAADGYSRSQPDKAARVKEALATLAVGSNEIASLRAQIKSGGIGDAEEAARKTAAVHTISERFADVNVTLARLNGTAGEPKPRQLAPDLTGAAEDLSADTERLGVLASAVAAAATAPPIVIPPPPPPPPAPTSRELLEAFAARNAVFFDNATQYRNDEATSRTLDALAPLISKADLLVRVVGYTDVVGNAPINTTLAQERADRVRGDLIARGVPANLIVAVGRRDSADLSPQQGAGSPNRRVTFEVGYEGEAAPEGGR